ncbi:hypothetical protein [Nafulsella turpanensis]|uniref:hypothetical protein n=1 Tax=Nafulsella turpanensis TaxID=1265690 RepID=UPI000345577A|nr:hypothetical protein [Nafulsella turpanensis]
MILKIFTFLLICYLLYRFIGFFFKAFFILLGQRHKNSHKQQRQRQNRRRPEGSIHVEYEPPKEKRKQVNFRGGEYVDYEEVDK